MREQRKYNHFPSSLLSPCLFRYFHSLQNLSLAYCRKFTDKGLQYLNLGNGCHKLIYLDLSGCTQVCLSAFSFLQQAKKSSREWERAISSPHVILTLCRDRSTLFGGFKLHGHSCLNFPQDRYYRLLASFHWSATSTNRQSSLDDEAEHVCVDTLSTVIIPESKSWKLFRIDTKIQTKKNILLGEFAKNFLKSQFALTWVLRE